MEKEIKIRTPDGKNIYGLLRGALNRPTVIIVHGLMSNVEIEALYYNAARFFEKRGFSVCRFSLYSWKKGARKLDDCTLKTHGRDLDLVIRYLRSHGAKKVFLIGHSYGGPTILHSKERKYDGIVFWDGTTNIIRKYFFKLKFNRALNGRVFNEGFRQILPEKMIQESKDWDINKLVEQVSVPVKFICAGKGVLKKTLKTAYQRVKTKKSYAEIKGASHNFEEDGAQEKLFKETASWFKGIK